MLSVIIITFNAGDVLEVCLQSVRGLTDEIIIIDSGSTDTTLSIAKKYNCMALTVQTNNLSAKRSIALQAAKGPWVLSLDADERLSPELFREIKQIINNTGRPDGYFIPFQNHAFGRPLKHGGERYTMLRLFRKNSVFVPQLRVHEGFVLKEGEPGKLENSIYHYSYRSIGQIFRKFTTYALNEARDRYEKGERSSVKKCTMYPAHMFYARFVKDKGYKDGVHRIPVDLGFAYMEFLMYLALAYYNMRDTLRQT